MRWLRLYSEARTDAKLESLPDDEFRVWHRLLCFANDQPKRGVITGFSERLLAVEVAKGNVELLQRTLASLQELRIIELVDAASYAFIPQQYENANNRLPLSEWRERRAIVFACDDYTCQYCGAHGVSLQCDHIIPLSRGGSHELSNLATACRPCNQSKYNRTPEEWRP